MVCLVFSGILAATLAAVIGMVSGASFLAALALYATVGTVWILAAAGAVAVRSSARQHPNARLLTTSQDG